MTLTEFRQESWAERFRAAEADLDAASDDVESLAIGLQEQPGIQSAYIGDAIEDLYGIQESLAILARRLGECRTLVLGG